MTYLENKLALEIRRAAVAGATFCPVTGLVLDIRTAVLLESGDDHGVPAVLSPEGWTQCAEDVRAIPGVIVTNSTETGR